MSNHRTATCRCGQLSAICKAEPVRVSVWEGRKHPWVIIEADGIEHND